MKNINENEIPYIYLHEVSNESDGRNTLCHNTIDAIEPVSISSNKDIKQLTIDEAVDKLGYGRYQVLVLIATGCVFASDAIEIMMLSFLLPTLKDEWDLSDSESALIASAVFGGSVLGTIITGPLADVYGRRPVFLVTSLILTIFSFATALADSYTTLVIMRFIVGLGVGGTTVPYDLLAETVPSNIRGIFLMCMQYFWAFGSLLVAILACLTIDLSWKIFVVACAVPSLIGFVVGALFVSESPHFLASQGRTDKALEMLRNAAKMNGKDSDVLYPSGTQLKEEVTENSNCTDIFNSKWRKITLLVWGIWLGLGLSYYGSILTIARIFSTDDDDDSDDDDLSFDYTSITISASSEIIAVTIMLYVVDKYGRVMSQVFSYALGGMLVFSLCLLESYVPSGLSATLAFMSRVAAFCAVTVTDVAAAELFGTEVRTAGHSSANALAMIGGVIIPFIVESEIPLSIVGAIILFVNIATIVLVLRTPETRPFPNSPIKEESSLNTPLLSEDENTCPNSSFNEAFNEERSLSTPLLREDNNTLPKSSSNEESSLKTPLLREDNII